ncbi:hypothetical protein COW36_15200 [bacterium (Candidatus Blackallbacteria) CG17_big_fil_post_rev_8_21_14_2_50_48_46]|uniref:SLC26A/SulP transporter domain-containing protein n=1 Tax=bacterium (Candidatus Blackallbacteria) CG17_big_fil_post_rev_8_21_14_2_50_48_46 TaxID=2014261 RepID=A0A2M7G2L5_9BACT|nr:MAG: hypothetical protein COW64_11350 [bacterium (Candidatus Blackallbacteria) CG18_big_fil_WC_8_21_14_2_50_49_26]PIW16057.1 MAG: hypothetical protein COW36_15200 [bacterium (Candidatus Blackallbacteria) CG17_big_fil_post_rev_8_21_14_2_50_48_46]PIW50469.1 MAG: hypothetical protein COW20_02915 [bacterium (Candidatus Blackallbacteria) CG13_big_fil_rev_8_21_14_2_50_49_14]
MLIYFNILTVKFLSKFSQKNSIYSMNIKHFIREFKSLSLKEDLPASLAVFLVAIPLCLGIAHASKAPLLSGLIAGIVGGLVIGALSKSPLSVSGPAAGLTAIVAAAAMELQHFEALLVAIVLAGCIQIVLGLLKAGALGNYIPSAVIKGMLAAIGVILILKQLPHLMGYDKEAEGVEHFQLQTPDLEGVTQEVNKAVGHAEGHFNTFTMIWDALQNIHWEIFLIGLASLGVILLWDKTLGKKIKTVPSSLLAVILGTLLALIVQKIFPNGAIQANHLVQLPEMNSLNDFIQQTSFPLWSALQNPKVYNAAFTIAFVASIESLLSIEAVDKLDPHKRRTPVNRELMAQGAGNILSGILGGLPVTSVIVRSSVNLVAGSKSKWSAILHGVWLLIALFLAADLINLIPLSTLSAVLIVTGFKLASPKTFIHTYQHGKDQFIPFMITLVMIVLTDLLLGVLIGLAVSSLFILYNHYRIPVLKVEKNQNRIRLLFAENLTFLNKAFVIDFLESLPNNSQVILDTSRCKFIDHDIVEALEEFSINCLDRGIQIYSDEASAQENTQISPERFEKLEALSHVPGI